ncbi:MAG: hypothetical protein VX475_21105, partial [Myxococcota bacterium]|nr:hypothetical protein [Myxococcota bacterium]
MDLTGIHNVGEFYSNHYLDAVLEGDLKAQLKVWKDAESDGGARRPSRKLDGLSQRYFSARAGADELGEDEESLVRRWEVARELHAHLLEALGYRYRPGAEPLEDGSLVPVLCAEQRDGQPYLWVVDAPFMPGEDVNVFDAPLLRAQLPAALQEEEVRLATTTWRELFDEELFKQEQPPRWVLFLAGEEAALIDRHKWGQGRYLRFELGELYGRREPKAWDVIAALLHRDVLNPDEDVCLLDTLDENSHKHAYAVSTDLKHGARRAIELLANEAIYYRLRVQRQGVFNHDELAQKLTRECLTYLYRLLFLFYIEARSGELGVVPMRSNAYRQGYSLESLRDLELVPLTTERARNGYYIHHSLEQLFRIVDRGFGDGAQRQLQEAQFETFEVEGLRSRLFDPEQTPLLSAVKFRNEKLQQVLQLLSLSKQTRGRERGRISYAQLGINQLGAVYEGLLSYTGFFAREDLYEVCAAGDRKDPEARRYFVPASALGDYLDLEIVKGEDDRPKCHAKGTYLFQLAGRDREKSASYYTPEVLTRCLTKYTLAERLGEGIAVMLGEEEAKPISADEILELTVCEPAMGSGAFLNEALDQLADHYLQK